MTRLISLGDVLLTGECYEIEDDVKPLWPLWFILWGYTCSTMGVTK